MKNKTYDFLKYIALVAGPALITFYGVIGSTLNLPHTQEVLTIATAAVTCLGTMLQISSVTYHTKKGDDEE